MLAHACSHSSNSFLLIVLGLSYDVVLGLLSLLGLSYYIVLG